MSITCVDWRRAGAASVEDLYAAEAARWAAALGWDTASMWREVERGRQRRTVHGLLAIDPSGGIDGWTFYILHGHTLQVGGLKAGSADAASALVAGIFASDAAAAARDTSVFAFTDAPGIDKLLSARGLTCDWYEYLEVRLKADTTGLVVSAFSRTSGPGPTLSIRPWRPSDVASTAALLARAYPDADAARPFARGGTPAEWVEYVAQLVGSTAVGAVLPDACFVLEAETEGLGGVVLTTRLAPGTAHVAQIAVDESARGRGFGRALIEAASAAAAGHGCERLTLLVSGKNVRAQRLYRSLGFCSTARFLAAGTSTRDLTP